MDVMNVGTQTIETERLILRQFRLEDAEGVFKNWINDKEVQSNYGEPVYQSIELVKKLLKKWISSYSNTEFYRWAMVLKENDENIGQIAFCNINLDHHCADIEYCISKFYQSKGYATEALSHVIKFTFENTGLNRLQAFHRGQNAASGRVLQKAQMNYEGTFKQSVFYKDMNKYDDKIYYAIIKEDYLKNNT